MILFDMSQLLISNIMKHVAMSLNKPDNPFYEDDDEINIDSEIDLFRHMTWNRILKYKKMFDNYGMPVLCFDTKASWRYNIFPNYKQNRKKTKAANTYNWVNIYRVMNKLIEEMIEFAPYPSVQVVNTEADDIIAVLADNNEPTMIISADKDFLQLQIKKQIKQYTPIQNKFLNINNAEEYLLEHIIRGDTSDGVPNILSDDDVFIDKDKSQKKITKKVLAEVTCQIKTGNMTDTIKRNYDRNRKLIDLDEIPKEIVEDIRDKYTDEQGKIWKKEMGFYAFLSSHNMKILLKKINQF